ncbi:glycosyltransferase family 2 protein [Evansella tamaricis]|uniref:Glycosyltransferase n=1 Tax=Evansella tamaricis TaxID=2069301 RepID=A0ABS6JD85_9BACI|nr:glycosyltransferase [Evansella tamaricis]MBU9711159.1 glycosyltransferase [Evansella tamaricis]
METLSLILNWVAITIVAYFFVIITIYSMFFLLALKKIWKEKDIDPHEPIEDTIESVDTYPLSIIVPAYNEEIGIVPTVRSLLSIYYPEYEIIVVDDGSKDETSKRMIDHFDMVESSRAIRNHVVTKEIVGICQSTTVPHVFLVKKENGGKADALNCGINVSKYPYFCAMDADSIIERYALLKTMKPIMDSDGNVIVTGGTIRVANGCKIHRGSIEQVSPPKNPFAIMQVIDYLRAFLIGRISMTRFNWLLIISGAFGIFQKEWVIKAGGYRTTTVGEDMELVVRLHRLLKESKSKERIEYIADPVCWTEVPTTARVLRKQRKRWHQGLTETIFYHRKMLFRPKYKGVGMVSLPYYVLIEWLGPVIELLGYVLLVAGLLFGVIHLEVALLMFAVAFFYGTLFSISAVLLEEWGYKRYPKPWHLIKLFLWSFTETFWYRPLTVLWRVEGIISAIRRKHDWGDMKRKGVSSG